MVESFRSQDAASVNHVSVSGALNCALNSDEELLAFDKCSESEPAEGRLSQLSRGTGAAKVPAKVAGPAEVYCTCLESLGQVKISRLMFGK